MVDGIVQAQPSATDCAAVVNHLWMEVSEIYADVVGEEVRNERIIGPWHFHSALVVALGTVEVVAGVLRLYGIEHSHVSYVLSRPGQQVVQAREETVEGWQVAAVERIAPGQFGQERDVICIVPDGMRDEMIDAFKWLKDDKLVEEIVIDL